MNPARISSELATKAKLLRESPFFRGWSKSATLIQKQMIFLVLAGPKPGGNAFSVSTVESARGTIKYLPDDPKAVAAFLDSLGLFYRLVVHPDRGTEAFVSLDPALPDRLMRVESSNEHEFGLLIGFPKTAVDAFQRDTLLPHDIQMHLMAEAGLPEDDMPDFRLSKDHAEDELEVLQTWWHTLQAYELT